MLILEASIVNFELSAVILTLGILIVIENLSSDIVLDPFFPFYLCPLEVNDFLPIPSY